MVYGVQSSRYAKKTEVQDLLMTNGGGKLSFLGVMFGEFRLVGTEE